MRHRSCKCSGSMLDTRPVHFLEPKIEFCFNTHFWHGATALLAPCSDLETPGVRKNTGSREGSGARQRTGAKANALLGERGDHKGR
jgi:hypothetical protein